MEPSTHINRALTLLTMVLAGACAEPDPEQVTGLTATLEGGGLRLAWTNPDTPEFADVVIRRASLTAPTDPEVGGDLLFSGAGASHLDPCPAHDKVYGYAVFARDREGAYAEPATVEATCRFTPFTLAVLPDTQYLSLSYFTIFEYNARWIAEQRSKRNILMTLHEGDITHNNTEAEWKNAVIALSKMDGDVPYVLGVGNHDMGQGSVGTTLFNKHFPLSKFNSLSTFGGSYPSGKLDNSFHLFDAGGMGWLVISLIYDPTDDVIKWAESVAMKYPSRRVVVVTHACLTPGGARDTMGERIWKGLVSKHPGMTMVFNGHYIGGVAARLVSDGDKGNKVYQMFANYQHAQVSGYGMFRLITLDRAASTISVTSYAPIKEWELTDDANKFVFKDVALGAVK